MFNMTRQEYTSIEEEIFNAVSHGIGAILGFFGLIFLIIFTLKSSDPVKIISIGFFGLTLLLMYLASMLFHSLVYTRAKKILRLLDHSSISVLIAGTYTPFTLIAFKGHFGLIFFITTWILAVIAILFRIFYSERMKIPLVLYLLSGWLGAAAIKTEIIRLPHPAIILLVTGGILYTVGTIFYIWKKLPFNHGIWHLFVMAGSTCHFGAMFYL